MRLIRLVICAILVTALSACVPTVTISGLRSNPPEAAKPSAAPIPSGTPVPGVLSPVPTIKPYEITPVADGVRDFDERGFVFAFSSERPFCEADFVELMGRPGGQPYFELLRYARNEIYARHGHIFKDSELISHYSGQAWYNPLKKETPLTELEKANIALIQSMESAHEGKITPVSMPQAGEASPNRVCTIELSRAYYVFYDFTSGTLSTRVLAADRCSAAGAAGFIRRAGGKMMLYGQGGKQLTRGEDAWLESDRFGNCIAGTKRGGKCVVKLLSLDTLRPIASVSVAINPWGEISQHWSDYLFIPLPGGRCIVNESGKYRIIGQNGETLANLPYEQVGCRSSDLGNEFLGEYYEYGGEARIPVESGGLWGAIDDAGRLRVPCEYIGQPSFIDGLAATELPDGQSVCIDMSGRRVMTAGSECELYVGDGGVIISHNRKEDFQSIFSRAGKPLGITAKTFHSSEVAPDGTILLRYSIPDNQAVKYALFDAAWNPLPTPDGVRIDAVLTRNRLVAGLPGNEAYRQGIIDEKGKWLLPPEYDANYYGEPIRDIGQNRVIVCEMQFGRRVYGLRDYDGNEILPTTFKSLWRNGDLYTVQQGDTLGLMDEAGRWIARFPAGLYLLEDD